MAGRSRVHGVSTHVLPTLDFRWQAAVGWVLGVSTHVHPTLDFRCQAEVGYWR